MAVADRVPMDAMSRTHLSDFAAFVAVTDVHSSEFNTPDGSKPVSSTNGFDGFPALPDTEGLSDTAAAALWDDWLDDMDFVDPWSIARLAVMDVITGYKGVTTTEAYVTILNGGIITVTQQGAADERYEDHVSGKPSLPEGASGLVFLREIHTWVADHADSHIQRCIDVAEDMSDAGVETVCALYGDFYALESSTYVPGDNLGTPIPRGTIETIVEDAVATVPAHAVNVMTEGCANRNLGTDDSVPYAVTMLTDRRSKSEPSQRG